MTAWRLIVEHRFPNGSDEVHRMLTTLLAQGANLMAIGAELKAAMARVEVATTALGGRVETLIGKVGTGMTEAEVAELTAEGNKIADVLNAMAKDPENPIPPAA